MIIKLREKYQIAIPKKLIKKLNLKTGDNIQVNIENNRIIIEPIIPTSKDKSGFLSQEESERENDLEDGKLSNFNSTCKLFEIIDN